jgi:hypothetical protein
LFKACRFPRSGSVFVAVVLLWLGFSLTLLSVPARGSQDSPVLAMASVLSVDQEAIYYPFALAEEADEDPVSAGSLTMLLLAVSFFGASIVGWLLPNAQGQGALCFSCLGVGEVLGRAREDYLPFLGVFRL